MNLSFLPPPFVLLLFVFLFAGFTAFLPQPAVFTPSRLVLVLQLNRLGAHQGSFGHSFPISEFFISTHHLLIQISWPSSCLREDS